MAFLYLFNLLGYQGQKKKVVSYHPLPATCELCCSRQSQQPTEGETDREITSYAMWKCFFFLLTVGSHSNFFLSPRKGGKAKKMHSMPHDKSPLPYPS